MTLITWTLGEILVFPLLSSFVANRADETNRGRYMGFYTLTFAFALVFGPAAGAWIYDTLSPEILWFITGGVGLSIGFGFLFLNRSHHAEWGAR
jgi:MFS family permease